MPYKDTEKQRQYQREWARKRVSTKTNAKPSLEFKLTSIEDLRWVFEQIISEVLPAEMDLGIKARVVAQLLNAGSRLLSESELETRMCAIEERLGLTATQWR